ncbi:FG-GAP repeat domain-containing protein [Streptomyces sp. NPDC058733]|uniref:FG-GAP repeat domain-containing protein n=1 Tax=Streptomyces sp. NPDC058733 TaxID=3346614 RepID=UPI0036AEA1D8
MRHVRRRVLRTAATGGLLLLAAACDVAPEAEHPPVRVAQAPAVLPVPHGTGSKVPDDFNGDGHRDLILNDLAKTRAHTDDPGIGIVYGSPRGLVPGAHQLLAPRTHAARAGGELPALFEAEASCDLDGDGFTDLVVSTDPPYDGQGRPPVPLQLLFGSPSGLTGRGVQLTVPDRAREGNDWPDQPVCGDFDGDGRADLVLHATGGKLSYLRGPFTRAGAPRAAAAPIPSPGNLPTGPAADVDHDGYDDLLIRTAERSGTTALVLGGPGGPTRTGAVLPAGIDVALGRFGRGKALDAAVGTMGGTALRYDLPDAARATLDSPGSVLDAADFDGDGLSELVSSGSRLKLFRGGASGLSARETVTVAPVTHGTSRVVTAADFDGDGRADLVVRTYRDETQDTVTVYPGAREGLVARRPAVSFTTRAFLTAP